MIQNLMNFPTLFQQGKELTNSATWKQRTLLANTLTAVIGAALVVAKSYGYDVGVDGTTTGELATGLAAGVAAVNAVLQTITSSRTGLPK